MSEPKIRLVRLSSILTQLQSRQLVTAAALSERHGVSIRTIYRDIRTLEQSGVPIVVEEGKGYRISEGYTLPPVSFTQEEVNALITVEQLILQNSDLSLVAQYSSAIEKVKATFKHSQKEKIELLANRIQVRSSVIQGESSSLLMQLQSAIVNYRVVNISYFSLEHSSTIRCIEPFALYTTQNNWILIAYCQLRFAFRAFRLDRIQSLSCTPNVFEPHDMTLQQYMEICRQQTEDCNQ
ncbi:helix-turn-helix transcriptional regulator [Myroides pelagicus]|uniref:WYL domain-containing protein n=1 Tax=Myroides pelagicus TaxID=270914 RepID=A0A7K1GLP1_9FLAO|nr:YafY family protein [Myroides pelagicus]MEC4113164.1 YafY family protein [Myroides pelagicus]MTH29787.1 WYL domain-containing protein [Myroides pelagicus]